jgi:predicted  nucleic acid-binding Zn-ribbon protein
MDIIWQFVALLATVGIAAFTVVKVARLFATRRELLPDVAARFEELERDVHGLQQELAETQERLDFAERLLSTAREERRIGN